MSVVTVSRSITYSAEAAGRAGKIACHVDRTHGTGGDRVAYSIMVHNDTDRDAQAFAFVPDALDLLHRTIVQSVVGPHSDFSTTVQLELVRYGGMPKLHVELAGEDIRYALIIPNAHTNIGEVESGGELGAIAALAARPEVLSTAVAVREGSPAALPQFEERRRLLFTRREVRDSEKRTARVARASPALAPVFAIVGVILAAVGFAIFRPQVPELIVPRTAGAGVPIPIAYRATGIGTIDYRVIGPDAQTIAGGTLAADGGAFTISLARDSSGGAYLVRVGISGVLGSALAEDYVRVTPFAVAAPAPAPKPPVSPPPQIRSLALDRALLTGGETLNVYYDVAASSGTVALLDAASQIEYGKSDLSPSGHTAFVVPAVHNERFLNVVLTAHRGTATTVSRVAVTAAPEAVPTPPAGIATGGQSLDMPAAAPTIVAPKIVRSGQPIRVDIRGAGTGLTLVLSDNDGTILAHRELSAAQTTATFVAPVVRAAKQIRLEATYTQGAGSETIVQTFNVVPR